MSSLYADYIKERLGQSVIEHEWGFLSYSIVGQACEILDLYIVPEERKSGKARRIADEVTFRAKQAGAQRLLATVWPGAGDAEISLQAILRYGFKMISADGGRILLSKELGE